MPHYRRIAALSLASAALLAAAPASAAVLVLASNVTLTAQPYSFSVTPADTFSLSYQPQGAFDPSPVLVSTTGTAAVTAFFGAPSVFFTNPPVTFGPATFPGFASVPTPTRAPFSLTASDLGLRYSIGADNYYGYARFAGSSLISVAFESQANTPILAGAVAAAVPEPATWLMMIAGFGIVGGSLRARRRHGVRPVAA